MRRFVDGVYLPDLIAIGGSYKDWFGRGENVPQLHDLWRLRPGLRPATALACRAAWCWIATLSKIYPVDLEDPDQIQSLSHIPGTNTAKARTPRSIPIRV